LFLRLFSALCSECGRALPSGLPSLINVSEYVKFWKDVFNSPPLKHVEVEVSPPAMDVLDVAAEEPALLLLLAAEATKVFAALNLEVALSHPLVVVAGLGARHD